MKAPIVFAVQVAATLTSSLVTLLAMSGYDRRLKRKSTRIKSNWPRTTKWRKRGENSCRRMYITFRSHRELLSALDHFWRCLETQIQKSRASRVCG